MVYTNNNNETLANEETDYNSLDLQVEKIHQGIMQLPSGYKIVCSLYLLEGYDHREIAQILDITESTSKSQYMRAKKKLKEITTQKVEKRTLKAQMTPSIWKMKMKLKIED